MKKKVLLILLLIVALKTEAQTSVFTVVDSLYEQGNYQDALMQLKSVFPKTFKVYDKTGTIYQSVGDHSRAIANFKSALEIQQVIEVQSKLGKSYESAGLPSKAIDVYEDIIKKDSTNLLVYSRLGNLYLAHSKPNKAEDIYKFLKKKDSLNPNYPYLLAKAYGLQKRVYEMGDSYLDAFNLDSLHMKSIYRLAKFFKDISVKDSTLIFIDKGLKIDSMNINFNQLKANVLYTSKKYKEAILHLKRLDNLGFKSANAFEMFGMCYMNLEDYENAKIYFKKSLDEDASNGVIHYRLGNLYYMQDDLKNAGRSLMMSIYMLKPKLDKQYLLLGTIMKKQNEPKAAIVNFEKAYKNNTKNHQALFELAVTSDGYNTDRKVGLKYYESYMRRFEDKDKVYTEFCNSRIKELRKELFLEGDKAAN